MSEPWPTVTLGEVAAIVFSGVDKHIIPGETSVRLCNYLDVYRNRRLTMRTGFAEGTATPAEIRRLKLRKGDVVITKDSETPDDIGVPSLVEDDLNGVICGYHPALLRPDNGKLAPAFLLHFLQGDTAKRHFLRTANGLTRFGLGSRAVASLPIALPPPDEQAANARILDAVDTALERTGAAVERARELDHCLLHELLEKDHSGALQHIRWNRGTFPRSVAMKLVGHKTESVYRRYMIVTEVRMRLIGLTVFTPGRKVQFRSYTFYPVYVPLWGLVIIRIN